MARVLLARLTGWADASCRRQLRAFKLKAPFGTRAAYPAFSHLSPIPFVADAAPDTCVLDAFKIAIAQHVVRAVPELTLERVFQGIHHGNKDVDFTLAIPQFHHSQDPHDLGKKILDTVCVATSRWASPDVPLVSTRRLDLRCFATGRRFKIPSRPHNSAQRGVGSDP